MIVLVYVGLKFKANRGIGRYVIFTVTLWLFSIYTKKGMWLSNCTCLCRWPSGNYEQLGTHWASKEIFTNQIQDEWSWRVKELARYWILKIKKQDSYVSNEVCSWVASEIGLSRGKPVFTPLEFNHKITSKEFDKMINRDAIANDRLLKDMSGYQRVVGRLLYLTMTIDKA